MFLRHVTRLGKPRKLKGDGQGKSREKRVGILKCDHCLKEFERYVKDRDISQRHFCSKQCKKDAKKPGGCMYLVNGGFQKEKRVELTDNEIAKRTKLCQYCNKEFVDRSTKGQKNCCSRSCSLKLGVQTRHERGSYELSNEQREEKSRDLKRRWKSGEFDGAAYRAMLSENMKAHWETGEMAEKSRETCQEKYGVDHWMQTEDAQNIHRPTRFHNHFREDLQQFFRSSWEANYARILNYLGKQWEYEPRRFIFSDGMSYLPDFLVEGEWIEIKGWMDEGSKMKLDKFKNEYSELVIRVISDVEYKELETHYRHLIPNWE